MLKKKMWNTKNDAFHLKYTNVCGCVCACENNMYLILFIVCLRVVFISFFFNCLTRTTVMERTI